MHGDVYQQDKICTSHVERMNGSIRLFCKRMNRLTYAFSKRWDNHRAALAVMFCHYNYCRKHAALKGLTLAMAHGLAPDAWSVRKMLGDSCGMSTMNVNLLLAALVIWTIEIAVIWLVGPRPRRFSLRTLLIAVTVASMLLGLIAAAS
jgi:hypothetical protein